MPLSIVSLPVIALDYASRGPGLHVGLRQLEAMLDTSGGREGYLVAKVSANNALVPVVMARSDLYVLGFQCSGNWFRFNDAHWPFSEPVTKLGYDGRYQELGGLVGSLTPGAINGIARLANSTDQSHWKEALRTLLIVVSECSRLVPVRMQVLGLLNGIQATLPLEPLAHYIQNWNKASQGMDMSKEVQPNQRVGFRDPTIIKR
jgi:Ribosome inactivating protein